MVGVVLVGVVGVDWWHRPAHVDWLGRVVRNHARHHMDCRGGGSTGGGGLYCGWWGGYL